MTLNWIGPIAAAATFFGIWVGHVSVRKIDFISPTVWRPAALALALGLGLELWAYLTTNTGLAVALGILGMTVLWDAFEFARQHRRIQRGHAPANPNNPRHARLLAAGGATTVDLLRRAPVGRPVDPEQALAPAHPGEGSR